MQTLRRSFPLPLLLSLCALLVLVLGVFAQVDASSAKQAHKAARAHSASNYLTGIGDEQTEMFTDKHWQQLHTQISRYILPYDVVAHPSDLARASAWIAAAEDQHQRILIAFYHSQHTPTRMPSVANYQRDVQKFIRLFPEIREYQPWNEANRGNVPNVFASPSAVASARYYQALKRVCSGCQVVGLDILDQQNVAPTLRYIAQFKSAIGQLRTVMPTIWGLHNYSDTNRASSLRTRAILAAVPGQVWLTETGGIVKFGLAFPNTRGSGLARAARSLTYMFKLASSNSRIKRLYIFQWTGSPASARFDAGLTDAHFKPRSGYVVVCRHMHGAHCGVSLSSH
ncbi:MAG TPA: hypothetical protein VLJ42_07915 [Solirubrobacteraceae bacterium]|nr:hypothetical protein [Solirubrobacteraceae bacterium]